MKYIVVYNNDQSDYDPGAIHSFITSIDGVTNWWHYLPNTYILVTQNSSQFLADVLVAQFPGLLFFITRVDLRDTNGVLAKSAWDWITTQTKLMLKLKTVNKPPEISNSSNDIIKALLRNRDKYQ